MMLPDRVVHRACGSHGDWFTLLLHASATMLPLVTTNRATMGLVPDPVAVMAFSDGTKRVALPCVES